MKGRKPIPANIKRLSGDGIHDSGGRVIPNEPQAAFGAPDIPEELTGDALLAWHSFTADMAGMDVITHADRAALIVLCQAWSEMQLAQRHIEKDGPVVMLPNGYFGPNPYCKSKGEARAIVLKMLTEFGLTPSSRSRIRIAPAEMEGEELELR